MGVVSATYAKCKICGETVLVRYIGKNGVLCPKHRKLLAEKIYKYRQLKEVPRDKPIRIIKDALPVSEGGFCSGQMFYGDEAQEMYHHCAFEDGTIIEMDGKRYKIMTVRLRNDKKTQIPVPI